MSDSPISRRFDLRLNLRHARRLWGRAAITADPRLDASGNVSDRSGAVAIQGGEVITGAAGQSISMTNDRPPMPNGQPWRVRIPNVGRSGWQRLTKRIAARRLMLRQVFDGSIPLHTRIDIIRAGRPLTPLERQEAEAELHDREILAAHKVQAQLAAQRMINCLDRLGFCDEKEKDGHRVIRSSVKFGCCEVSPLEYKYWVDAPRLPHRVKILDLVDDSVCTDLSCAVGHPVTAHIIQIGTITTGVCFTVEIAATMGVPNLCKFSELLPLMPNTAPPLAFIAGYSEGKRFCTANLEDMPHLLGGGQTNGGKSNMMHVMLCTLISRNAPADLRLLLIDLKFNGIEMDRYTGVPHLYTKHEGSDPREYIEGVPSGIATMPSEAMELLKWADATARERGAKFTKDGCQNLRQWNEKHPGARLPYIVLVADELAQLRLDPDYGKQSYAAIQRICATGRAAGLSIVAFTQSSNRQVIDELVKINLPGRICFSVADASSSILFVGDGAARNLMPHGRAIFKWGTEKYLVQTPLIEPHDIAEIVKNARDGKMTSRIAAVRVTPEELIEWAVHHNESRMVTRELYAHFGETLHRIAYVQLNQLLRDMDRHSYQVGADWYYVKPGAGGLARGLEVAEQDGTGAPVLPDADNITNNKSPIGPRCPNCGTVNTLGDKECPKCGAPL